jgi:hypothetical protein
MNEAIILRFFQFSSISYFFWDNLLSILCVGGVKVSVSSRGDYDYLAAMQGPHGDADKTDRGHSPMENKEVMSTSFLKWTQCGWRRRWVILDPKKEVHRAPFAHFPPFHFPTLLF